jgi:predicted amidophosphoribosyltransferase
MQHSCNTCGNEWLDSDMNSVCWGCDDDIDENPWIPCNCGRDLRHINWMRCNLCEDEMHHKIDNRNHSDTI